jgi:hypothetical protein
MRAHANAAPAPADDLPVDAATLYPEDDGFLGRRAKAARVKLLGGIADVLRRALAPGETVRYAARGVRYHVVEHVFGGAAVAQYQNMTALVLTDRRLLLVQLGRSGKAADMKNEVPLAAIQGAKKGFMGLRIKLADGKKLQFASMRGADAKRLQGLLPTAATEPRSSGPSLVHLCPACLRAVPGPVGTSLTCPQQDCRIPFRDPGKAARLSALVPGLGDLYLRHHFFGALEFLGSMAMLGLGVAFALQALADRRTSSLVSAAVLAILFVGVPRVIDYFLTLHMGRKGLVPLALAPAPGAQARNLPSYPRWSPLLFVVGIGVTGAIVLFISQDLRHDAAVREAAALAAEGRLDDAQARWAAIERDGGADEERRVKFALALLDAGDLEGAGALEAQFQGTKIDAALAGRWNAASAREHTALEDYRQGIEALVAGDASAWTRLDRALAYFGAVKRPHLPRTRGELHAHLAEGVLREPLAAGDVERARRWIDELGDAPTTEVAAVLAAYRSASGSRAEARSALAGLDAATLSVPFQLLALEARARVAESEAEREGVRSAARAFQRDALDDDEAERLEAVAERVK